MCYDIHNGQKLMWQVGSLQEGHVLEASVEYFTYNLIRQ